jgi:hypothetical protein
MPMVNGMKFPYDKEGKANAKRAQAKKAQAKKAQAKKTTSRKADAKKAAVSSMRSKKKSNFSGLRSQIYGG